MKADELCIPLKNEPGDWGSSCTNYYMGTTCAVKVNGFCNAGQGSGNFSKKIPQVTNMSTESIATADAEKIVLYNCDGTQCKQTSGYINTANGSVKYRVGISGGAKVENGFGDCKIAYPGELNVGDGSDFKLCITDTVGSEVEANGNIYRIKEKTRYIFTDGITHGFITIKTQTNIFAWDNISEGKYLLLLKKELFIRFLSKLLLRKETKGMIKHLLFIEYLFNTLFYNVIISLSLFFFILVVFFFFFFFFYLK